MKYLKYFQEDSEYIQFKDSSDYVLPNVSYVVAANSIYYESPSGIPNNEIWYTSTDGEIVEPNTPSEFNVSIISNTYENGQGIITFDGDVTTIGGSAFRYCSGLTSVTIPDSVTTIGEKAFRPCNSLAHIYCKPTIPPTLYNSGIFDNVNGKVKATFYFPQEYVEAYKNAKNWKSIFAYNSSRITIVGYDFENNTVIE
jgi:hypothetical protein